MKSLLFLRHGKSDWDAAYRHDHDRPLAKRGRLAARDMGQLLRTWDQMPDVILSSSARRAHDTVERAKQAGDWSAEIHVTKALYHAAPQMVLREIRRAPDPAQMLMLVGHEPTWSETVSQLIGGGDLRFPTAAIARVDVHVTHWREVDFGRGELIWFVIPRLLSA